MRSDGWYTSPSQLEAEKRVILRRLPVIVGRETQLLERGRFLTFDVGGVALLLTRDASGTVRAMQNVCRHRSARLVLEDEGSAEKFVCRHHAWTYDLAGQLARPGRVALPVALERSVEQFADACALVRYPTESRHGFLWVVPSARGSLDVASALGDLDDELGALGLGEWTVLHRTKRQVAASWKLVMDALLAEAASRLVMPSSVFAVGADVVHHVAVFPSEVPDEVGQSAVIHTVLASRAAAAVPKNPFAAALALAERVASGLGTGARRETELRSHAAFHEALDRALAPPAPIAPPTHRE